MRKTSQAREAGIGQAQAAKGECERVRQGSTGQGQENRHAVCEWCAVLALMPAVAFLLLMLMFARPALAMEELRFAAPGADADLRAELEASSLLKEAEAQGFDAPLDILSAARSEYGRLLGLLYEYGHYAAEISVRIDGREAADIAPLQQLAAIRLVEVHVMPGPQFTFGRIEIAPLAEGTELPESLATGATARSTVLRDAAQAALEGWRGQGHAMAELVGQQVTARHGENRLDVSLRIAPGPVLNFGALQVRGAEATRPERIAAIAGVPTGERYDPEAVARAESRLRRTGTFTSVALRDAERANPDGSIDIDALVEEAPPRRLGAGVEIDTESGLQLSGYWLHRNLLGGAERFRLEGTVEGIAARVGGLGVNIDGRYTRPATLSSETDLEIGLNVARLDERDFEAWAIEADALLRHRFSDRLTGRAGLALRFERALYGPDRDLLGRFGTLAAPVALTYDRRDRPLDATRGYFAFGEAKPYIGFGDAGTGARLRLDGRGYLGLAGDGRLVLAGRAQLGAIVGSALDATPRDYLFYSGGGGTVRGLPFQSLGVEQNGVASGGRGFAALTGEVRFRVSDTLSLATFADAGYVSAGLFSGDSDWHMGAGAGIRYNTPLGPLRLDLATPVRRNADATDARALQIYVGIGQAF
ncbi:MAG: BamA/TamA family outer membrane protein [Pararhodobacter sp.]|nr:BamA/TamA family outer membrane protein [Pararhodobacter sp.]